jgi:hypothetical protein
MGKPAKKLIGHDPKVILKVLQSLELKRHERFHQVYRRILDDLARENVFIID